TLDDLKSNSDLRATAGVSSPLPRQELSFLRGYLADAFETLPHGNISRKAMLEALKPDRILEAISLEWQLLENTAIYPGMPVHDVDAALLGSPNFVRTQLRIQIWKALYALVCEGGPEKSGRLVRCQDDNGKSAVQVRWREDIKSEWADSIVITMDATLNKDMVAPYFDRPLITLPSSRVALCHVNVLQVIDRSFGASSLIPSADSDDNRRLNRAREVYWWICLRAIQYRGQGSNDVDVFVVCQKDLEIILVDWGVPDNVEIAHFNAIRGLDRWGGVRCQIVIGRVMPKPADVEALAEALTGSVILHKIPIGEWYPKETVGITLEDGTGWAVENDRHPDAAAEGIRHQICEGELIQAIGRARAVNRTAETPLQIDILTDICLPLTVHQPIRWAEHAPGIIEAMLSYGLIVGSFTDSSLIYPGLFQTEDAARKAAGRKSMKLTSSIPNPDIPHYICSIWGMSGLGSAIAHNYTPALATVCRGERSTVIPVIFDPHQIADPAAWLSARLGVDVQVITGPEANAEWAKRQKRKAGRK
ncbi:MAG: hypothetical protein V7727_19250, partial [Sneathiella sp.]